MTPRGLVEIVGQNIRRNRKNLAFSAVGIVVGISSFVFFIALGAGIHRVVTTEIFPVEANRLRVVPRTAAFGGLGGGRVLDDEALAGLRAVPGVVAAYPRMKLAFLATTAVDGRDLSPATIGLLAKMPGITDRMVAAIRGVRVWLEIMGDGIDPALVAADATVGSFSDPGPGEPIPVLLSENMIEIYNASFAEARSLPKVSRAVLPFLPPLPLTLNNSFLSPTRNGPTVQTRMKLVGLSRHAIMGGITVPLETARRLNRQFAGERAASLYESVLLEVASADQLGPAQEAVGALGFDLDLSGKRMAESVALAVMLVTLGFTLISLVIVGIAAINIAHTFFMLVFERKRELGLMRALGASRSDIRRIILGEASFLGGLGGLLGLAVGVGLCLLVDLVLARFLPDFPFKPGSFFAYPWWLFFGGIGFAVLFCWLGAFLPAQRAASLDPASTLSGR